MAVSVEALEAELARLLDRACALERAERTRLQNVIDEAVGLLDGYLEGPAAEARSLLESALADD